MPWEKGKSGNPGGRPKLDREVRALAREHTKEAVETLVCVMQDEKAPHSARVNASNSILDRGYGKPAQAVVSEDGESPIKVILKLSGD